MPHPLWVSRARFLTFPVEPFFGSFPFAAPNSCSPSKFALFASRMILRDDRYHSLLVIAIRLRNSTIHCLLLYFSNTPALPFPMVAPVPAQIAKLRFPLHAAARRRPLLTTHHSLPTLFSLPSSASRGVNISLVLSSFRILPVATGVHHSSFPTSDFQTSRHAKSFVCIGLLPLCRLLALFSAFASFVFNRLEPLFTKHPGWGLPNTPSCDCAYFPSPRGCTLCDLCVPHSVPSVLRFLPPFTTDHRKDHRNGVSSMNPRYNRAAQFGGEGA